MTEPQITSKSRGLVGLFVGLRKNLAARGGKQNGTQVCQSRGGRFVHLANEAVTCRATRGVRVSTSAFPDRLVGLVVKASASRAEDPGFELALQWLPCQAPGVIGSVLGLVGPVSVYCDLGEMESLACNFYHSVAARKIVRPDPSLRYTRMLLGC